MPSQPQKVKINLPTAGRPFNRYFLEGIGSCHAYLTLREDWRDAARLVDCSGELTLAHSLPPNGVVYYEVERV